MPKEIKTRKKSLHVAFIPDGNRRWARKKGFPYYRGHQVGEEVLEKILYHIIDNHPEIKETTVWAFSTENFKRGEQEKRMIFSQIRYKLKKLQNDEKVHKNRIRINVTGPRLNETPKSLRETAHQTMELTKHYGNMVLNIAIGYGGRFEIFNAALKFAKWLKDKPVIKTISEQTFEKFLDIPSPVDIVIRTGGELRLSGFMLYQMAYSELFFSEKYWPDFTTEDFDSIMKEFYKRQRRYGR
jgi:undecaprenyl diphosphate synthase